MVGHRNGPLLCFKALVPQLGYFSHSNHPLCVLTGSLAAMEEGEEGLAGDKSPLEREGATSDHEGSAECDTSSPPGSEGEPHRHDRRPNMV